MPTPSNLVHGALHTTLGAAFTITAFILAVDSVWIAGSDLAFDAGNLSLAVFLALVVAILLPATRPERLRTLARGYILIVAAWPALRLFNHLTFTLGGPFTDDMFAAFAATIGNPWMGYVSWLDAHPWAASILRTTYGSLTPFSIAAFLVIALTAAREVADEYLLAFVATAVVVSVIGMFFPAYGPSHQYGEFMSQLHHLSQTGVYHVPFYEAYLSGSVHTLAIGKLPGMTTFPSFHTAMGILLIYGCRTNPATLVVAAVYSLLMIAATPVFGGHYLPDVAAGALVAALVILLVRMAARKRPAPSAGLAGAVTGP